MKRRLEFFAPGRLDVLAESLKRAFDAGARKCLVIGAANAEPAMVDALRQTGFSWVETQFANFHPADVNAIDTVLVANGNNPGEVSRVLHGCIDANVTVIAPVTEHHSGHRTVFLVSIPKAGTHMVIRLLGLMGLDRSPDRMPRPGTWSTPVGYEYHAPLRDLMANDWFDPIGRQLLLRSPIIFVYRNPLDIVVSELDWFARPDHAFSGYLSTCANQAERLERLIARSSVMGTIRDRINRYAGWINFENVVPVSYEELVGSRGGGSDADQVDAIWAMQLKLQIPGSPQEYAEKVYDPASPTFSKGRIGRHAENFEERHFLSFGALKQDFMQLLGYSRGSAKSSKVTELRQRPLKVKDLSPDILYMPRLAREGLMGWNIVEAAGRYFPVQQGEQIVSATDAQSALAVKEGFATLRDAMDAVIHGGFGDGTITTQPERAAEPKLIAEGYLGFNLVCYRDKWYGLDQAAGKMDLASLSESALEEMQRNGVCVVGNDCADLKTEILRLVVQARQQQQPVLPGVNEQVGGATNQVNERSECLSADALIAAPEAKSVPKLLEEGYRGFNLVTYDGKVWAVEMGSGPVDLCDPGVRQRLRLENRMLESTTLDGVRSAVDLRTLEERINAIETRLVETTAAMEKLQQQSPVNFGQATSDVEKKD